MTTTTIKLGNLKPNPFRHLDRYPVDEKKIEALMGSINQTSFWDNLLARPTANGQYEIAYGHNRLEALRRLKHKEITIPVRDLSDDDMVRIMANENMEEWSHSSKIEQETIRTVVEGFAAGKLHLPDVPSKVAPANVRHAPLFGAGAVDSSRNGHRYTVDSLCAYLGSGWKEYKVAAALGALEMTEGGIADEKVFADLTTKQAQVVTQQAKRVLKETKSPVLAKKVAADLADGMKKATTGTRADGRTARLQDVTIHNAKRVADDIIQTAKTGRAGPGSKKSRQEMPDIDTFAHDIAKTLVSTLENSFGKKLDAVVDNGAHLHPRTRATLTKALMAAAKRLRDAAESLNRSADKAATPTSRTLRLK